MVAPARGEIWWYDPDPTRGHEQARRRPGLIVSLTSFNRSWLELAVIVPITRTRRNILYRVEVSPEDSGLSTTSYIMCEQIRAISIERLLDERPVGRVDADVMHVVENRIRSLLDFEKY